MIAFLYQSVYNKYIHHKAFFCLERKLFTMPQNHKKFHSANGKRLILIADDEAINRELLINMLEDEYDLITAADGREAYEQIDKNRDMLSLVLLDLLMPEIHGLDLLRKLKEDAVLSQIPVIVMTADKEAEVDSLNLGAIDFIPKPFPEQKVILARVLRTIELSEDRQIIQSTERDHLTGLYNREFFYSYAQQYDQHHKDVAMDAIVVDVNHFHMINERYGKAYGDEVLKRIGEKVRSMVQDAGGIVCRREADTFLVYCPHRDDYKEILVQASVGLAGDERVSNRVRLRMGVYSDVDKTIDIERRFDRAKVAADTVKGSFSNPIAIYDEALHESEIYVEQLLEDFHEAIDQHQFVVYYQPKFDVRPEIPVLASAEALVRWCHPKLGMINPGIFIPLFEDNGLIQELDRFVWREAARQIKDWYDRLGVKVPVSVNVSRIDMYDPNLIDYLVRLLEEYSLGAKDLLLEITESAYTQDSEQIIEMVNRLRALGFQIEMDDFGTGYSSLNMISRLPIDALKLDMQFIRNAFKEGKDTRIIEVIIDIAGYLAVPVIAEGVETEEQLNTLKSMGCDIVQGYYFSRPVPAEEYEHFVEVKRDRAAAPEPVSRITARKADVSLGRLTHALAAGFESIYYVEAESGEYVQFASGGSYDDLQIQSNGADFFGKTMEKLLKAVHPGDRKKVGRALTREALLDDIEQGKNFMVDYRLLSDEGQPKNRRLKVVYDGYPDVSHLVIGVIDLEAQEEKEQADQEKITYASIAQALAADYFNIYYVDLETEQFTQYSSGDERNGLNVTCSGEHFFDTVRDNAKNEVYSEDRDRFLASFTRENILNELREDGSFSITYRMMLERPTYVNMKANIMDTENDRHIVFGVNNVDAQVRREQEYERQIGHARELANRDALTGVKSRLAYLETERKLNQAIASGEETEFAVVVCDVNNLKEVNDTKGHKAGDLYLKKACMIICEIFKHSPVFRIGGDEFAVILSGSDYECREQLMLKLRRLAVENRQTEGVVVASGISELIPGRDSTVSAVFDRADAEMYKNKGQLKSF